MDVHYYPLDIYHRKIYFPPPPAYPHRFYRYISKPSIPKESSNVPSPKPSPPKHNTNKDKILVRWTPPEAGMLKLNFDGGVSRYGAGCVYIVRDEYGSILLAGCDAVVELGVIEAELSGLLNGLKRVVKHYPDAKKIWVEGDSSIVISFLKSFDPYNIANWPMLKDIQKLLLHFIEVKSSHVYREGNQTADYLAGMGKHDSLFYRGNYTEELVRFSMRDMTETFSRLKKK